MATATLALSWKRLDRYGTDEQAWEDELRGHNGRTRVVVDARGQRMPDALAREMLDGDGVITPSEPGNNLVLSIDARLQALAEERFPGREGAVVTVKDTGPGLPREVLLRLAEPKQSTKPGDHAGLGLQLPQARQQLDTLAVGQLLVQEYQLDRMLAGQLEQVVAMTGQNGLVGGHHMLPVA